MKRSSFPTAEAIAKLLKGRIVSGRKDVAIKNYATIDLAKEGDITFLTNRKYLPLLKSTKASAIVMMQALKETPSSIAVILVDNPDLAFSRVVDCLNPPTDTAPKGVHPKSVIAKGVKLGKGVSVGAFTVIENGAVVGEKTVVYSNVYIGHSVKIGRNCLIYPNAVIRENCILGDNIIIHSGTVVGSDGFGFTLEKGERVKLPQRGNVVIEDDVELGANCTVDRARFGSTIIRKNVKTDNLVHIAHNVEVGENTLIIAGTVIGGSAKIGKNVILAGHSGVDGHVTIGDNVKVGAKSGVLKDIPSNTMVAGFPARPYREHLKEQAILNKLPEILKNLKK
ncbi:MAG: UDP-3-O-(3-hydroxymyristoyl)glucosamine N-acyltransferase [Planctomycetes bacterium]|nr:UDP-3-O-(3-hydroxymyristoyl)glucosamine N-acyltransferase [Planctomycetota bacterium]